MNLKRALQEMKIAGQSHSHSHEHRCKNTKQNIRKSNPVIGNMDSASQQNMAHCIKAIVIKKFWCENWSIFTLQFWEYFKQEGSFNQNVSHFTDNGNRWLKWKEEANPAYTCLSPLVIRLPWYEPLPTLWFFFWKKKIWCTRTINTTHTVQTDLWEKIWFWFSDFVRS